jgi:hypothetical protein
MTKIPKSKLKDEGFILADGFRGFSFHGRKDVVDQSSSFHGGQEGERKRERESDCTRWLSAFSPFILSSSPACKTGATHIQSWNTQRFLY